jgi:anaerobic carbon-monoxide dehydrogenase iron sulfur subunit
VPRIHIDTARCVGCRYCMLLCSLEKEGQIQPAMSRIRIARDERTGQQNVLICRQCTHAPCVQVCPTGALDQKPDGIVSFYADRCINCRLCVNTCPYDGIWSDPGAHTMLKCDLCQGSPVCVAGCPVSALEVTQ